MLFARAFLGDVHEYDDEAHGIINASATVCRTLFTQTVLKTAIYPIDVSPYKLCTLCASRASLDRFH